MGPGDSSLPAGRRSGPDGRSPTPTRRRTPTPRRAHASSGVEADPEPVEAAAPSLDDSAIEFEIDDNIAGEIVAPRVEGQIESISRWAYTSGQPAGRRCQ